MDKSLIEKYKAEMMGMYRSARNSPSAVNVVSPNNADEANIDSETVIEQGTGKLIVTVTTVRSLYPLENAKVTILSIDSAKPQEIDSDFTDKSGRTKAFLLETPNKSISLDSGSTELPYELYNIEIKAEGYIDTYYLNVPVFSGTTSIQQVNMNLLETAGKDKGPIIIDTAQQYTLSPNSAEE